MNSSKKLDVNSRLSDLHRYIGKKSFSIQPIVLELFHTVETIAYSANKAIYPWTFLAGLIKADQEVRSILLRKNCDPERAADHAIGRIKTEGDDEYTVGESEYSEDEWRGSTRASIIDWCMTLATKRNSHEISREDVILSLLMHHDEIFPATDNSQWADERLNVPFNTLAHVVGTYNENLWIKFDDLKKELGLESSHEVRQGLLEVAPGHVRSPLIDFFSDHPDFRKNCFLIMPFVESSFHVSVRRAITNALQEYGFKVLRADDREYSNDLFTNIETYMCGCRFAISVHERHRTELPNANVALEIGYMRGQRKEVCLLKEASVVVLPSDLQGQLYASFNSENLEVSVSSSLAKWLLNKRLINQSRIS